jgi:hypothetical protein
MSYKKQKVRFFKDDKKRVRKIGNGTSSHKNSSVHPSRTSAAANHAKRLAKQFAPKLKKCPECGQMKIAANFCAITEIRDKVRHGFVDGYTEHPTQVCDDCYFEDEKETRSMLKHSDYGAIAAQVASDNTNIHSVVYQEGTDAQDLAVRAAAEKQGIKNLSDSDVTTIGELATQKRIERDQLPVGHPLRGEIKLGSEVLKEQIEQLRAQQNLNDKKDSELFANRATDNGVAWNEFHYNVLKKTSNDIDTLEMYRKRALEKEALDKFNSHAELTGKEAVSAIKFKLDEAGIGRNRMLLTSGAEIRGWTNASGSTGFSVKQATEWDQKAQRTIAIPGQLDWHVVVSGKQAGIKYADFTEYREHVGEMSMHEVSGSTDPVQRKIKNVFESMGLKVHSTRMSGYQSHWDDDVDFNIITDRPAWLLNPTAEENKHMY